LDFEINSKTDILVKITRNNMTKKTSEKKALKVKTGIDQLEEIVKELFSLLSLDSKPEFSEDPDNDAYMVNIVGEAESGLLIGSRGRTLSSLQTVIGLIYRQRTGEWKRIILNVSDWREKEEERLHRLAEETATRAKETGETQNLYNLTPAQRRIVHMTLSEDKDIKTESEGEGTDRYLAVSPK
jgi:spoIIIJ-associated protein